MLVGPVFSREAVVSPRRVRHYVARTVYALSLLLLICTAWMVLAGTQIIRNVGDMARFGTILFQILAPLQLAVILFLSAVQAASSVSIEKDKQTLILLLMSRLTNSELVLGKLLASLLNNGVMLMTSLPIFMLIVLFGGTSFQQVGWTFAVTLIAALAAGSLGNTIALWRDKTFQALALVALAIVFWIGAAEGIGLARGNVLGIDTELVSNSASPFRAVIAASHSTVSATWPTQVAPFLVFASAMTVLLCGLSILRVRKWNPSRDIRVGQKEEFSDDIDMFTGQVKLGGPGNAASKTAGSGLAAHHVDDRSRRASTASRRVWDNPVLWREMCTWAYGRKIIFIRLAYWLLAAFVFFAIFSQVMSGEATRTTAESTISIAPTAKPLAPFMLVSLVMINALAVTSITNERDGRALDLLRVTDISPKEFLFGKLLGVLYVSLDLVLLPIALSVFVWLNKAISAENLLYVTIGMIVLDIFVAVLGLHAGMSYAGSRQAISVSLGTVFFLFLGVVTAMVMMVSFTGNVEAQLAPFLACIFGGAIGLYIALGWNTPSPALVLASAILPFTMFYSITSLLLEKYLSVILVVTFAYGFTTTAMIVPRLSEFIISTGRAKSIDDD